MSSLLDSYSPPLAPAVNRLWSDLGVGLRCGARAARTCRVEYTSGADSRRANLRCLRRRRAWRRSAPEGAAAKLSPPHDPPTPSVEADAAGEPEARARGYNPTLAGLILVVTTAMARTAGRGRISTRCCSRNSGARSCNLIRCCTFLFSRAAADEPQTRKSTAFDLSGSGQR